MIERLMVAVSSLALGFAVTGSASAQDAVDADSRPDQICAAIMPLRQIPALPNPSASSAKEIGCAVAAWQLAAKEDLSYLEFKVSESSYGRGWNKATFYIGLERLSAVLGDDALASRVRQYSYDNGFELGGRPWHGDDQAVAAVYGAMARQDEKPEYMEKSLEAFDHVIAQNYANNLEFTTSFEAGKESNCQNRWCWADAIFMAPPAWALASKVSGNARYADYAAKETRAAIEYLQDPETGLLFRDSRYFKARTDNGKKVFWSRGNGWVFAGLARFIEALPEDHPERALFINTFRTMANQLAGLQRADGYWPTSLADPELITNPETSGTAFFGFGLAWGLNNGVIEGKQFENARDRAWDAMRNAVAPNGKLGWVQQVGKDPQMTQSDSSQLYGVGGMLLFAAEMLAVESSSAGKRAATD